MESLVRRRLYTIPKNNPLSFLAEEAGTFTFTFSDTSGYAQKEISYSRNGGPWVTEEFAANKQVQVPVEAGDVVLWKGKNFGKIVDNRREGYIDKHSHFSATGRFSVSGNALSIVGGRTMINNGGFYGLFEGCTTLTSIKGLNISDGGLRTYDLGNAFGNDGGACMRMFYGCTSLVDADITLEAVDLPPYSYHLMFAGCTSLTVAPRIKAGYVSKYSMYGMFSGCTSLVVGPKITVRGAVYFSSCDNIGADPNYIHAFEQMFYNCENLSSLYFDVLQTNSHNLNATNMFTNWLYGVATEGIMYYTRYAPMRPTTWTVQQIDQI